jgi:signal transduction histidine kinase
VVPLLDLHNPLSASEINDMIDSRLSEMATTIKLTERGSVQLALDIVKAGAGSQWMSSLTQMLNDELAGAANRQSVARISIYDAIAVNHAAVILLTLSSVLALYVFIRQLRLQEQERQAQEARLEATIEKRTVELRELAQHLQTVREAEKDHLARELHDQLGALLTVAKLELEGLRKRVQTEPDLTARVERVGSRINEVIVVKRRMVEDMRPSALSMLGLRSALVQHCREMAEAMNVPFHVDIDEVSLTPESELVIYRFVQEALTNIAKYSNAKNVWVELHNGDKRLDILVRDDGVGFDPDLALAGHHGLTGMRYRIDSLGGTMSLSSRPGGGTSIRATIAV